MEWYIYGIIVFALFWILLAGGLPVAFSLGTTAMVMMYVFWGFDGLLNIAMITYTRNANFLLIAIPLFIFMGECIALSGIGSDAFRMINAWFGRVPGGIAITTIGAGTIFGAVTGF